MDVRSLPNAAQERGAASRSPLRVVLRCRDGFLPKVRYVLDTLMCAAGVPVVYVAQPPADGPWVFYGEEPTGLGDLDRCVALPHLPQAWTLFDREGDVTNVERRDGLAVVLPQAPGQPDGWALHFDVVANAFYFLSSWSERKGASRAGTRGLYAESVFERFGIEQDIVDRYLERLVAGIDGLCERLGVAGWPRRAWPGGASHAVVLTHDVDFLPNGLPSVLLQGAKTVARHLLRQRDPADALRAAAGLLRALTAGRDPFGCVPEIIEREKELGVRASFQVAVARRHPNDVNYRIEDERTRAYLEVIRREGFDLCLHGSYRSTENPAWYVEEAALLERRLGKPLGSRQHFLSFDYDALFRAQEEAGIRYDMSMGYPDRPGPRAGFSYPYFPYCLAEDRPYRVLQISLFLMDVTLRSYLGVKGEAAWRAIEAQLGALRRKRGCASVVWHPIVFGGARDPGYDRLFWRLVREVVGAGGVATDGRTIDEFWREQAGAYASFA